MVDHLAQSGGSRVPNEIQPQRLHEHLLEVGRLSLVDVKIGSLAHELNQPLTAISNYAQGCSNRVRSGQIADGELEQVLDNIGALAMRAAEIVERLRAYNGRKDAQHSAVPLSHIIDVCTTLLQHEFLHTNVQLVVELPAEPLPDLWVDATQIELVFVSLFRNGMESFPNLPKNERLMLVTARKLQNSQIEVAIQDGGRGLSSLDPELMFQPFSSTKKHGLGMGLPVSRSIVELHGGQIWAEPDPQGGSCFRFTLPTINPRGV